MAEIKNLKKTADRILRAIKDKEKIILFADADMDGTCSVIILEESIKSLGGEVKKIYFPDREKEGYGINEEALNRLKNFAPALLISLDCGIGNFKETKIAKKIGFEVIIIDHHEILKKIPSVSIVVDPKQEGDKYPFKDFSTTGIVYKLSEVLLKDKLQGIFKKNLLELAALATISDMMPQTADNLVLIEEGISFLPETLRPGLKAFWKFDEIKSAKQIKMMAQKMISVMNAAETKDNLTESYLLLNAPDEKIAQDLIINLIKKSAEKHLKIRDISFEIEKIIIKDPAQKIVFEGKEDWPLVLMGPVASKICRDYQKPVFVYRKGEKISRGAVRTPKGINSVSAMKSCSSLLETFGGHPLASGFTVKNKNLEKFKNCLVAYFSKISK